MAGTDAASYGMAGVGEPGSEVRTVCHDGICAIVSDAGEGEVEATRHNLMTHAGVLEALMQQGTVVPMRFGVVVPSEDALVGHVLGPLHDQLDELCRRFEGTTELHVKALYREDVVLAEIVHEHPEVARLREVTRDLPEAATYYDRIRLGELIAKAMEAKRRADGEAVVGRLAPLAIETRENELLVERMVVNTAFLVATSEQERFDEAVAQLGSEVEERIDLKYVGPFPPYSFTDVHLPVEGMTWD